MNRDSRANRNRKEVAKSQSEESPIQSLPKEFREALKYIPEAERGNVVRAVGMQIKTHSGPLPPAEVLQEYNQLIPNGAERIMRMAEKQQDHRMDLENRVVNSQLKESSRGQWMGYTLALAGLGTAILSTIYGHEVAATIIGSIDMVGLVYLFVNGKTQQRKDLKTKKEG